MPRMCGWVQTTAVSDADHGERPTAPIVSRRQILHRIGVLTAAAVITASPPSRSAVPDAGGTAPTGGAPSAHPSAVPADLGTVMTGIDEVQVWQEEFYKDLHRHPDVWGEEGRTPEKATKNLQETGVDEVLQIGGGVVGIIRNGDGRSVLFRADMDALP